MHNHLWKRCPVTDWTVTYICDCGSRRKFRWGYVLPHVLAVDDLVTGQYGGTVQGEAVISWEFSLPYWMQKIADLGLSLEAEGTGEGDLVD